jgi:hypothetical protein
MTSYNIPTTRLQNHHLIGEKFIAAKDAVEYYGAVQAQEWAAAKWAVGLRMKNGSDEAVEKAFNEGLILRTHIMRPTWHFVTPENIRWMQKLTSPRVLTQCGYMFRREKLDEEVFATAHAILKKELSNNNYRTRDQLRTLFESHGISTKGQRLAYILIQAELSSLICSGPRIGKQFSYALLEERAPHAKNLSRDESLASLTLLYFTAHGPAQLKDFAWWSGLTAKECAEKINMIKSQLDEIESDGKTYFHVPRKTSPSQKVQRAFLLSIYDEYTIAYKDRSDINVNEKDIEKMIMMGNALTAVVIIDGKVSGTWKRTLGKKDVAIKLSMFRKPDMNVEEEIKKTINQYGSFIGLPVHYQIGF